MPKIQDVLLQYITQSATAEDLDQIALAVRSRHRALGQERAAQVAVGAMVTLDNLSPKILNGLAGEVVSVRGNRCDVRLDQFGTDAIAWNWATRLTLGARAAQRAGEGYLVPGVPQQCCIVNDNETQEV